MINSSFQSERILNREVSQMKREQRKKLNEKLTISVLLISSKGWIKRKPEKIALISEC